MNKLIQKYFFTLTIILSKLPIVYIVPLMLPLGMKTNERKTKLIAKPKLQ